MSELITVLVTGSEDFGKVEVSLPATDPSDALAKLKSAGYSEMVAEAVHQQVLLAKGMKAAHGLSSTPNQVEGNVVTPPADKWGSSSNQPVNTQPTTSGHPAGKVCEKCHGPLKRLTGSKNGRDWAAWVCENSPRGDRTHTFAFED